VRSVNAGTQSIITGVERLETAAKRILGITLFAGFAKEAIDLSDSYRTLQARLKLVSDSTEEFKISQTELFNISQRTRSGLSDTYNLYTKLETAIKLLGGTQAQALKTTETLNQAIKLTSMGAAQDSAAILQFSQALGSGVLRGDEFNSVMENAPGLASALAIGLDVPVSKLREMAQAGKLTADQLINALGKSAPQIAEQFALLPVTVSGAMTQVNNALLKYIGNSENANSATSRLSTILQTVAKNFDAVVSSIMILAEIYAARLVAGLIASTKAFFDNAEAARVAAIAQQEARAAAIALLQVKAQEAAVAVQMRQQLVFEAEMRVALASSTTAQATATTRLTAAQKALEMSQNRLASANTRLGATQEAAAVSSGVMSRALGNLGTVTTGLFGAWIAFDIGKTFGEWLRQFEGVRIAGSYLSESFVMLQAEAAAFVNGMTISERWAQIQQIRAEFNAIRASETTANQAAATAAGVSETQKTEIIKAAELQQQASFAATQTAVKALTATIDAETKTQSAAIQQSLTDRLAAINASDISDTAKETQRVAAKVAAINQTILLDQQAATLRLQLIEQEYAKELISAQANAERLKAVELSKKEAKLAVYRGIADFYAGEVAKLSTLYGEETAAFEKTRLDIQGLAKTHEQALRAIDQEGMTEYENLRSEQNIFDDDLNKIRIERKKGEQADQTKINALVDDAKKLSVDLTKESVAGDISKYKAKENVNRLYEAERQALLDNGVAHGKNALAVKTALDAATTGLANANIQIKEMTTTLSKEYLLKVGMDESSLSAAQAAISELIKPETKIITIVTQNASGGQASEGQAGGGQSRGGPVGFAGGGFAKRSGMLPGFGGGDRIRALLEAGEFIIRKEAVQALGMPVMHLVNAGQLPIKRASGGLVSDDELMKKLAKKKGDDDANIVAYLLDRYDFYSYDSGANTRDPTRALRNMLAALHISGRDDLKEYVIEAMPNDWNKNMDAFLARKDLILEKIKSGETVKAGISSMPAVDISSKSAPPTISMPAVNLQQFADKAVSAASAQAPSSKVLQAAHKTVNVQFTAPGGETVAGQFNESDMDKLFKTLKDAGLRTSGSFA
jgi:tape measure domain-containing protein